MSPLDYALPRTGASTLTQLGQHGPQADRPRARPLFADLLQAVARVAGIRRVRYTSPHPKDLRPETMEVMAREPAVCPQLHLPLQAGSDRILSLMHRGYTAGRYLERLAMARDRVEDLAVTTDIIVGFPGETEADFERTLRCVQRRLTTAPTPSSTRPVPEPRPRRVPTEMISAEVAADRFERLRTVVERSALARHRARLGRIEEVLVEGPSKRDPSVVSGRTAQGKLVHVPAAAGKASSWNVG